MGGGRSLFECVTGSVLKCVTDFHKMSLNLKFGNLIYLHVSNLQVLLVILILKSRFYSKKCGYDVFLLHVWWRPFLGGENQL